jgi:XTP/dITP diphosphohydrolase
MNLKLIKGMRLVAATHNPGKAREIEALLDGNYRIVTAGSLNLPEPDETESTFVGNAMLKARHAAEASGEVSLADDSGLSVAALDGAPGIFSARWAGPGKDFALAMKKVEERLEEVGSTDRRAWFTSALAVAWPDGPCVVVEGRIDGALVFPPRGDGGHGYDPIFMPEGSDKTFAEMEDAEKDAISHRARAFARLKAALID